MISIQKNVFLRHSAHVIEMEYITNTEVYVLVDVRTGKKFCLKLVFVTKDFYQNNKLKQIVEIA